MNEGSSRSHSLFMTTVTQFDAEEGVTRVGTLFMVDLAGSEMVRGCRARVWSPHPSRVCAGAAQVRKTGVTGVQLDEAKAINRVRPRAALRCAALCWPHASPLASRRRAEPVCAGQRHQRAD